MVKFDPKDYDGMIELMDQYGDSDMPFGRKNRLMLMYHLRNN